MTNLRVDTNARARAANAQHATGRAYANAQEQHPTPSASPSPTPTPAPDYTKDLEGKTRAEVKEILEKAKFKHYGDNQTSGAEFWGTVEKDKDGKEKIVFPKLFVPYEDGKAHKVQVRKG